METASAHAYVSPPSVLPAKSTAEKQTRTQSSYSPYSLSPVGTLLLTGWTPPLERFLWRGRAVHWAFLARSLVGGGTLVGAPPFGRRIVLTLVGLPDAVIADGVGGPPDFTSKAASETPNECTELGQVFLFSGTYHCRHAMDDPWGAGAEEEEGGWPASIGIPPDEYRSCGGNVGPGKK